MNLISRAKANHAREAGRGAAERGMKRASGKLQKATSEQAAEAESRMGRVELLLGRKVNELQDEAKDRFSATAIKRIDDLESRLEELKGLLPPTKRQKRSSLIGKLFMFSIVVSGVVAAVALIKSKMREEGYDVPFETGYGGNSGPAAQTGDPLAMGGHFDNNDLMDDRGERPNGSSAEPRPESRSQTSA